MNNLGRSNHHSPEYLKRQAENGEKKRQNRREYDHQYNAEHRDQQREYSRRRRQFQKEHAAEDEKERKRLWSHERTRTFKIELQRFYDSPLESTVKKPARTDMRTEINVIEVFQRYPFIGTVDHLGFTVREDGLRYFNWEQIKTVAWDEVPLDLIRCECCNHGSELRQICPDGYAVYRCVNCKRQFRVIAEEDYYFQEDVSIE